MPRASIVNAKTVVLKVGSSLLASVRGGLDTAFVARLVGQISTLREQGRTVVLVSSGAVAAGLSELGLSSRPRELPLIQAAAAVGQGALMQIYRELFRCYRIVVAQILLTRDGLHDRQRFLHARNTILALLARDVLPIINENDTVAVEELRLKMGDNDALAVSVAQLVEASALIILSDIPGLYDRPPSQSGAKLISHVQGVTPEIMRMGGGPESGVGSGGMASKLNAARAANLANIPLLIADGKQENVLPSIFSGLEVGTIFTPPGRRESSYRQWIAYGRSPDGALVVDDGARRALVENGGSLLAIGVREVRGEFLEGDTVAVMGLNGQEFARGLVNFSAGDMRLVMGKHSVDFSVVLGHDCDETAIHRDNLVLVGKQQ